MLDLQKKLSVRYSSGGGKQVDVEKVFETQWNNALPLKKGTALANAFVGRFNGFDMR
jgi:hypothetical protein